ncbi:hypothetical protein DSO57_1007250 [Entomophthora muscae]|uniref:Uncharacterized protein n=1 Tax=Entomophthora muscae TaxID=34485 RepID=A0ACC2UH17_9FUNG|nr:hypothetical protein DSO57_1007250 [Entomophthora muscae]
MMLGVAVRASLAKFGLGASLCSIGERLPDERVPGTDQVYYLIVVFRPILFFLHLLPVKYPNLLFLLADTLPTTSFFSVLCLPGELYDQDQYGGLDPLPAPPPVLMVDPLAPKPILP